MRTNIGDISHLLWWTFPGNESKMGGGSTVINQICGYKHHTKLYISIYQIMLPLVVQTRKLMKTKISPTKAKLHFLSPGCACFITNCNKIRTQSFPPPHQEVAIYLPSLG